MEELEIVFGVSYIFTFVYLVVFSFGANRYNREMGKISSLKRVAKHPNAKKETIDRDYTLIKVSIKRRKEVIYILFGMTMVIHYVVTYFMELDAVNWFIPGVMFAGFVLLILLFYSFKGAKVTYGNNGADFWGM